MVIYFAWIEGFERYFEECNNGLEAQTRLAEKVVNFYKITTPRSKPAEVKVGIGQVGANEGRMEFIHQRYLNLPIPFAAMTREEFSSIAMKFLGDNISSCFNDVLLETAFELAAHPKEFNTDYDIAYEKLEGLVKRFSPALVEYSGGGL